MQSFYTEVYNIDVVRFIASTTARLYHLKVHDYLIYKTI